MARPVAFVTGAGSGKGLETATILASSGYDLALFDLNCEPLENLARTLRQQGAKVVPVDGDVASDMDRAITAIKSDFGRLDAVVANAGINGVWCQSTISHRTNGTPPSASICVEPT